MSELEKFIYWKLRIELKIQYNGRIININNCKLKIENKIYKYDVPK